MTPKEKAKELFEKFRKASQHKYVERTGQDADEAGKILALMATDEIIYQLKYVSANYTTINYWEKIKKELENI